MDTNQPNQNIPLPPALNPESFKSSKSIDIKTIIIGILSVLAIITLAGFIYVYKTKTREVKEARESQIKELAPLNDNIDSLKTESATLNETTGSLREEATIAKSVCMSNTYCKNAYNSGKHSLMELPPPSLYYPTPPHVPVPREF